MDFDGFWQTGNFDVQNAYLCGCVKVMETARRYSGRGSESRRSKTHGYYVNNRSISIKIC